LTVSQTATLLDVAINNGAGQWDNNSGADWHVSVTGSTPPPPQWVIDGALDADASLVAQNGASRLYAGVREGKLYVAASSAAGSASDHFILVAGSPGALRAAMWAKAGQVAAWTAFLGNE